MQDELEREVYCKLFDIICSIGLGLAREASQFQSKGRDVITITDDTVRRGYEDYFCTTGRTTTIRRFSCVDVEISTNALRLLRQPATLRKLEKAIQLQERKIRYGY